MCIFDILFPEKVDALFFNNIHCDYDTSGEEEGVYYNNIIKFEKERIRFSLKMQKKYKHCKIRIHDAALDEDLREDDDVLAVNRIFCEAPPKADCKKYIKDQIKSRTTPLVHFVSYNLQCIFSVYDDRGCDIVFFDNASYVKMYDRLKPYFLEYDLSLMDERVQKAKETLT